MTIDQSTLDHLAQTLDVRWKVVNNVRELERYDATMTLTNTGSVCMPTQLGASVILSVNLSVHCP